VKAKRLGCQRDWERRQKLTNPAAATSPESNGQGSEWEYLQLDPKGGELYLATTKPRETVVEVGTSPDVQIALSKQGIGATDLSNHLVAGFPRSFPQDSWSWERKGQRNKRVNRAIYDGYSYSVCQSVARRHRYAVLRGVRYPRSPKREKGFERKRVPSDEANKDYVG